MRAARSKSSGIPAAAILAGGISRHGYRCDCPHCRAEYARPLTASAEAAITGTVAS